MEPITLEDRLRGAIDEATEADEDLSLAELLGTLLLLKAELLAAALSDDDDE